MDREENIFEDEDTSTLVDPAGAEDKQAEAVGDVVEACNNMIARVDRYLLEQRGLDGENLLHVLNELVEEGFQGLARDE